MASFRQRGGKWQARVIRDGYPDQTKTFETKPDAERWAQAVESEIDKGQFVSVNEAQRTTLGDVWHLRLALLKIFVDVTQNYESSLSKPYWFRLGNGSLH